MMTKLQTRGIILMIMGAAYAIFWIGMQKQQRDIEGREWVTRTKLQFDEEYPNLDRAWRYLGFRLLDEDYYFHRSISPWQFVLPTMKCHAWLGIALFCLGGSITTMRSVSRVSRIANYVLIVCLILSLGISAVLYPSLRIGFTIFGKH